MPETFPVTGLIHHLTPELQSPPSRSCQEKPPFPAAGCHGNPSLRIPSQRPASSLDHGHAAPRRGLQTGGGCSGHPGRGTHPRSPAPAPTGAPAGTLAPGSGMLTPWLIKKGKESGEPEIPINPPLPPPAPARNLTCC